MVSTSLAHRSHTLYTAQMMDAHESITFRNWQDEDLHLLLKWKNDAELSALDDPSPFFVMTEEDISDWFKEHCVDNHETFIICRNSEEVGCMGLKHVSTGQAEFYIIIGEKQYWHQGIGAKGLSRLEELALFHHNAHLMSGQVLENNTAAMAFYKRLGYTIRPDSVDSPDHYLVVEKQIP